MRYRILERDNFKCLKCGSGENLTIDHIIPKSMGGSDRHDNLQTLCRECNGNKGAYYARYVKDTKLKKQKNPAPKPKQVVDFFEHLTWEDMTVMKNVKK